MGLFKRFINRLKMHKHNWMVTSLCHNTYLNGNVSTIICYVCKGCLVERKKEFTGRMDWKTARLLIEGKKHD